MLQNKLTAALENRLFKNLKETGNDRSRARIISCSGRNAGAWITALPSPIYNRVLTDEEFRVASRLRCGVTPVTNLPDACSCGSSFTSNPTHSLASTTTTTTYFPARPIFYILLPHISRQIRSPSHLSNSILSSPPIRRISQRNIIRRDNNLSSPHLPASQQNSRTTLAVNVVSSSRGDTRTTTIQRQLSYS